ncbi:MAG: MoxR family ATPase [Actinomycetota bacterium]|nr:MoxR family ATPase [Actinomycetota bacterium]
MLGEVERAVIGKRPVLELLLTGMLAGGHVIIEDLPGLAKTLMASSLARAAGLSWSRVQFTPDLLPADLTGSTVLEASGASFEFRPGPIFANLVVGDEINRAPPKTQSAMLEAMAEGHVSVDGTTHPLPRPFCVLATQNPVEYEGTYPLPEAQLDRFLLRVSVGYPSPSEEREILERRIGRRQDDVDISPVASLDDVLAARRGIEAVHVAEPVLDYVIALVGATRHAPGVSTGASPRGSLALLKASRVRAALAGRTYVTPDDVKALAVPALAHRLILEPELWVRGARGDEIIGQIVERVPAPSPSDVLTGA